MKKNTRKHGIGDVIKFYRKLKKLTQEELADKLNISGKQVQKYEYNLNQPSIEMIDRISLILEIPVEKFHKVKQESDFKVSAEKEILENYEMVELLKNNPGLKKFLDYYNRNKNELKDIDLINLVKIFKEVPKENRRKLINHIAKVISLGNAN